MKALEESIAELVIYSEGAVSWTEAWDLSFPERQLLIQTINKLNQAKAGKSDSSGDFSSNMIEGDHGFDAIE